MQKAIHSKTFQVIIFLLFLVFPREMYPQVFSVRASTGFVHLPLSDWSNFFGNSNYGYYQNNNPNLYFSLYFIYTLSETHAVSLGTEIIRTSASLSSNSVVDWKLQGVPISIGYEYRFASFNEHFIPTAGLGVSYFMSKVEGTEHYFNQTLKRTGNGYGIHGFIGLISKITQSLSIVSQVRYRYSNGMAFTDKKNDIKVEFTGFDFSTGLEWTF